jgi:hypothetical protein
MRRASTLGGGRARPEVQPAPLSSRGGYDRLEKVDGQVPMSEPAGHNERKAMAKRGSVRVERDGPVTVVPIDRPERRNAVDGPAAAQRPSGVAGACHTQHAAQSGDLVVWLLRVDQPVAAHRWGIAIDAPQWRSR